MLFLLDVSKAFDRAWYEALIFKLRQCGITRGNIIGPSLFSTCANDVKYYILSSIKLFANDRAFIKEIDSPVNYFRKINNDFETLNSLSKQ